MGLVLRPDNHLSNHWALGQQTEALIDVAMQAKEKFDNVYRPMMISRTGMLANAIRLSMICNNVCGRVGCKAVCVIVQLTAIR